MSRLTIGADPELFLIDNNGRFRSAHNMIPGTKDNPMPVLNGAIQVDGVAAEFNIEAADTADQFCGNIRDVLTELSERLSARTKTLSLYVTPVATFDKAYFRRLPKRAKELGCTPDYNAWKEGRPNTKPSTKEPFRTGSGHIHLGWDSGVSPFDEAHMFDCIRATKQLDATLYPMSLLWDNDDKRRELYGMMGSFRPKSYGVEYRPLSNMWVADPDLQRWVFEASQAAIAALDKDEEIWDDSFGMGICETVLGGKKPSRLALLEYHDYIVNTFDIPELPEAYTRTV